MGDKHCWCLSHVLYRAVPNIHVEMSNDPWLQRFKHLAFSNFRYVYIANSQVTTDILSVGPKYMDPN